MTQQRHFYQRFNQRFCQRFCQATLTALAVSSLSYAFGQDTSSPPSDASNTMSDGSAMPSPSPKTVPPSSPALPIPPAAPKIDDATFYAAVDAAMAFSQKQTPDLHKQAMHIWKQFQKGSPPPHYTYRYWARNLIIWLKKNKNIIFDKMETVIQVFTYLYRQEKISDAAAVLLGSDCWSYLVHLEGLPDWDRKLPADQEAKITQEEISA